MKAHKLFWNYLQRLKFQTSHIVLVCGLHSLQSIYERMNFTILILDGNLADLITHEIVCVCGYN